MCVCVCGREAASAWSFLFFYSVNAKKGKKMHLRVCLCILEDHVDVSPFLQASSPLPPSSNLGGGGSGGGGSSDIWEQF